ncbi:MAG: hypothetical protein DU429_07850 [Candidatus Tokpelaia sp.]|nr:MAG: hypothetical protein DU430_08135 [Candidatus Tokpelaia sp.]KAA6205549.1 MAG: hypothetical protein DU429_07850 [Candidatus Tokpelaia sp.]KAA6405614.1 hypothetical protein DPQ22_03915 [Candidatus Tokpelaia sp.]
MVNFGRIFAGLLAAAAIAVFGNAAWAQAPAPTKLNQYDYWGAYSYKAEGKVVCYILSTPTKQEPASVKHGDNFFLISRRNGGKLSFEPQFMAGYDLKPQSQVVATVGAKSFNLFTKGNAAWVEGEKQESALLAAMRSGSVMEVKAVSKRGTETFYTYSLKGIGAALKSVQKCK